MDIEQLLAKISALETSVSGFENDKKVLADKVTAAEAKASAAEAKVSELTVKLADAEEKLGTVTTERDQLATTLSDRDTKDREATVDKAIQEHGLKVELRDHLLNWAKSNPEGFAAMYPAKLPDPKKAGKEHLTHNLTGGKKEASTAPPIQPAQDATNVVRMTKRELARTLSQSKGIPLAEAQALIARGVKVTARKA